MAKRKSPKPKPKTKEKPETPEGGAYSCWTEPFLADTKNMTPEERARFDQVQAAHRAALRGNFEPGRRLGLFSPKPSV